MKLQKEIAKELNVPPATFTLWWISGVSKKRAPIIAGRMMTVWEQKAGPDNVTSVHPGDLITQEGFRRQIRLIWGSVNEGRGRVKSD